MDLADRLRALYNLGLYSLEEIRSMITGEPNEHWVSTVDCQYVDVAAALRNGHSLSYDKHGNFIGVAAENLEAGDLVEIDAVGAARRADVVGVALEAVRGDDGFIPVAIGFYPSASFTSYASGGGDMDYNAAEFAHGMTAHAAEHRQNSYQYSKFNKEAVERAWKLLEQYMTPEQHFAFMEGTTVELINKAETHRLLLNKKGDFTILQGIKAGSGIKETSGKIRSYDYPLGDEISAFLDWFRHRTGELIAQWNCGTFGIVKEGQRR